MCLLVKSPPVQLQDGLTYTFYDDKGSSPSTLKYLIGPSDDTSYGVLSVQTVGAITAVKNSRPNALAATMQGDNIHLFYADDTLKLHHLAFSLATKTWKEPAGFVSNTIATGTGISAVGEPVLKVQFVDSQDTKSITEAYFTERTWTTRTLKTSSIQGKQWNQYG